MARETHEAQPIAKIVAPADNSARHCREADDAARSDEELGRRFLEAARN